MRFAVEVGVRWSDMDAYGHVNHARTVTLIEQARSELLFNEMPRRGMGSIDGSIVVSRLTVEYVSPLVYDGEPALVEIWVTDMKAASFVLRYTLSHGQRLIATAATTMVPYNLARSRPRRLTAAEREFLALWTVEDGAGDGAEDGAGDGARRGVGGATGRDVGSAAGRHAGGAATGAGAADTEDAVSA